MNLEKISQLKNILVTGGAGAIGSNLVRRLAELKVENIYILDNLDSGRIDNIPELDNVHFINGSIVDEVVLKEIFTNNIEVVFHLAANFANQNSIDNPEKDLLVNILGTLKLLEFSKSNGIKKFIYYNTSCMYNKGKEILSEDDLDFDFETPYAISKYSGEQYCFFYFQHHQLPVVSLRIFNSYGPYEHPGKYRNVIPNFFMQASQGKPLTIMGDGKDTRNFTYVADIVDATIAIALTPEANGLAFNVGNEKAVNIIDLATKINDIVGSKAGIEFIEKRSWDKTKNRTASLDKIKKIINYQTGTSIDDGLKIYYNWFKSNK